MLHDAGNGAEPFAPPHRCPVAVWNEREKLRLGDSRCAGALTCHGLAWEEQKATGK